MAIRRVGAGALRPGDVLLSHGGGGVDSPSYWARLFDGGDYSHAAYWDGAEVVEAVAEGVRCVSLEEEIRTHEYVDVYRFSKDGRELGHPGWEPEPIHERAHAYVGSRYATTRLAVIGLLVGTGRKIGLPQLERLMRGPLGIEFERDVKDWRRTGLRPLICSELVASAFYESTPDRRFALGARLEPTFLTDQVEPALTEGDPRKLRELLGECAQVFAAREPRMPPPTESVPAPSEPDEAFQPLAQLFGVTEQIYEIGREVLTSRVTPRDLQNSPTLQRVGRLG
jgi:hypothetical protein